MSAVFHVLFIRPFDKLIYALRHDIDFTISVGGITDLALCRESGIYNPVRRASNVQNVIIAHRISSE